MKNIPYLLALHSIDGLGPIRLKAIIDYFKDPKLAWEANVGEMRKIGIPQPTIDLFAETRKKLDPPAYAESIKEAGILWITIFDENYPKLLKQIYDPPIVLYYKGEISPGDENAIAIVGSRKMTGYGKVVTQTFTSRLSMAGLTIVSGLATGVDTQAHKTAIEAGGRTLAVLGGGLDRIFPPQNLPLAQEIAEGHGAILSEFSPNTPSWAINFPIRNRIIVGLSRAVLVTEASSHSGSMITARLSQEVGRDVFAVPGPVTSALSEGPANLIKEGAKLAFKVEDILSELGIEPHQVLSKDLKEVSPDEKKILDCLENESMHIDEICRKIGLEAAAVSGALLKMEIAGFVQNLGSGNYCMSK